MTGFGERLRELRQAAGLSQKGLAEAARVSQNAVSQWENGEREPSWSAVVGLAVALGVDCTAFNIAADTPKAKEAEKPAPKRKGGKK